MTAVFTNLGASGRNGPTSLGSHYTSQDHDGQVTLSSGIQQWTVPYTGEYNIEAIGAAGGYDIYRNSAQYRGRGARMIGTFSLCKDEIIQILVGQEGGINSVKRSSGGGGGTFVVRGSNTSLIIAGGGGGIQQAFSRHPGCDADTSTTGNPGYRSWSVWSGGSNGHGAQVADNGYSGNIICDHFQSSKIRCYSQHIISLIANNYYCHASKNILITQVCAFGNLQTSIPSSLAVDSCFDLLSLSIHYV